MSPDTDRGIDVWSHLSTLNRQMGPFLVELTDPNQLWSIGLSILGAFAMYLAARSPTAGWTLGLCAQCVWVVYAVQTQQWGFLISVALYGSVYASNLHKSLTE